MQQTEFQWAKLNQIEQRWALFTVVMIFTENIILNSPNLFYRLADKPITSSLCTKSNVLSCTQERWNRGSNYFFCMIETSPSFINDLLFLFLPKVCLLESQLDGNLIASAFWQTGVHTTYATTLMRKEDILGFTDWCSSNVQCNVFNR